MVELVLEDTSGTAGEAAAEDEEEEAGLRRRSDALDGSWSGARVSGFFETAIGGVETKEVTMASSGSMEGWAVGGGVVATLLYEMGHSRKA